MMDHDLWSLYTLMLKSRLFEQAITSLWNQGRISGEMHLGTGEEAIIAGVVTHLLDGDAMALDHRGTAALLMRGVDPLLILRELLGRPDGLCGGMGGHMHLYSREHLAASSGIVGASGPAAAGFALAAQLLRPGSIAVAFFGDGAMNQGMLLESLNLAAVWKLPVLFVCKDDGWAITTRPGESTAGDLATRARGLGVPVDVVDGLDVLVVREAAGKVIERLRAGLGPAFLLAHCIHLEGHFLGLELIQTIRNPIRKLPEISIPMIRSFLKPAGASLGERLAGLAIVLKALIAAIKDPRRASSYDPLVRARNRLSHEITLLNELETQVQREMDSVLASALLEAQV